MALVIGDSMPEVGQDVRQMSLDHPGHLEHRPQPGARARDRARDVVEGAACLRAFSRLHTAMNPDFFKGTVVEAAVAKEVARP